MSNQLDVHPHDAKTWTDENFDQLAVFEKQIKLACDMNNYKCDLIWDEFLMKKKLFVNF